MNPGWIPWPPPVGSASCGACWADKVGSLSESYHLRLAEANRWHSRSVIYRVGVTALGIRGWSTARSCLGLLAAAANCILSWKHFYNPTLWVHDKLVPNQRWLKTRRLFLSGWAVSAGLRSRRSACQLQCDYVDRCEGQMLNMFISVASIAGGANISNQRWRMCIVGARGKPLI